MKLFRVTDKEKTHYCVAETEGECWELIQEAFPFSHSFKMEEGIFTDWKTFVPRKTCRTISSGAPCLKK